MYFTRHTVKRINRNNDIEDSAVTYQYDSVYLRILGRDHPDFDVRRHVFFKREMRKWYRRAAYMMRGMCFDGDQLRKHHNHIYASFKWVEREHRMFERKANIIKLNWIHDQVRYQPLAVINGLNA
jgi:hypothetical protein